MQTLHMVVCNEIKQGMNVLPSRCNSLTVLSSIFVTTWTVCQFINVPSAKNTNHNKFSKQKQIFEIFVLIFLTCSVFYPQLWETVRLTRLVEAGDPRRRLEMEREENNTNTSFGQVWVNPLAWAGHLCTPSPWTMVYFLSRSWPVLFLPRYRIVLKRYYTTNLIFSL